MDPDQIRVGSTYADADQKYIRKVVEIEINPHFPEELSWVTVEVLNKTDPRSGRPEKRRFKLHVFAEWARMELKIDNGGVLGAASRNGGQAVNSECSPQSPSHEHLPMRRHGLP